MGFIVLNVIIKLLIRMGKNLGMKCSLSLLDFKQQNYETKLSNNIEYVQILAKNVDNFSLMHTNFGVHES